MGEERDQVQTELWNQLGHAVSMAAKEDQITWTIFGVFWTANAVLLVALFTTGALPRRSVGIVVCLAGAILSWVWFIIQRRAIGWLAYYERLIQTLEERYLNVPADVSLSAQRNTQAFAETVGQGLRVRPLMLGSGPVIAVLWMGALCWFACRAGS